MFVNVWKDEKLIDLVKHEISEHSQMPTENKIFLATTGRVPTVVAAGSRAKEGKSKGK